jgi:hypothetical protein
MTVVPPSLNDWLRQHKAAVFGVIAYLLSSAGIAGYVRTIATETFHWPWLTTTLLGLQATVILLLLFAMPTPLTDEEYSPRATIAVEQFASAWEKLWLFWFFEFLLLTGWELAAVLGWRPISAPGQGISHTWTNAIATTVLNLANNLPTLALTICYVVAAEKTVVIVRGKPKAAPLPWSRAMAVLALITAMDFGVRALLVTQPMDAKTTAVWDSVAEAFEIGSGLAAGLATALFVGRLDSKFIDLPLWAVISLYAYAVIQPAWSQFIDHPALRATLLNVALVLKTLMFAVMYWLFRSGVFLFYVERFSKLYDDAQSERLDFLRRVQSHLRIVNPSAASVSHSGQESGASDRL